MREKQTQDGLTVRAIAGTHVVTLAMDLTDAARQNCLGFAIKREDHTEGEVYWLRGMKTFKSVIPDLGLGQDVSSNAHPYQTFQWGDYSAKPDHKYTYTVVAKNGPPAALTDGASVSVTVTTEPELSGKHSVFFNRGVVASQEYARHFQNQPPEVEGQPAFDWLSRGLFEALLAFFARATDATYALYGAVYEFQWPAALKALGDAKGRGADVHVLYDGIVGVGGPVTDNEKAIQKAGIGPLCEPRTSGKIMHNKFFVLAKDGAPMAVWTGSTNLTENGIFGHSNVGHLVEDAGIAAQYKAYWDELRLNNDAATEKAWTKQNNPAPPTTPPASDTFAVFSPHSGLSILEWYSRIAGGEGQASKPLFMTFAFGMHKDFQQVFEQTDGVLRFALMDKAGSGAGLKQGKIDVARIRKLKNVLIAVGNSIVANSFDRWLKENPHLIKDASVLYVHTKYMLVDPLGTNPVIVTGSANFSDASTSTNNENMLVIRGNERLADIYVGEFMRLYSHHAYREQLKRLQDEAKANNVPMKWQPQYLDETTSWQDDYYRPGNQRMLRRQYFVGN